MFISLFCIKCARITLQTILNDIFGEKIGVVTKCTRCETEHSWVLED